MSACDWVCVGGNEVADEYNVVPFTAKTPLSECRADTLMQQIVERAHALHALVGTVPDATVTRIEGRPAQTFGQFARLLLRERRDRDLVLEAELLGDPAWDMVLDLFVAGEDGKTVSVSSSCHAAGVPSTTALRWLSVLADRDLILRTDDLWDKRRVNVSLKPSIRASMAQYLERTALRRGITLAAGT
jgi:DNA-binding MarR family transcriptional regulator